MSSPGDETTTSGSLSSADMDQDPFRDARGKVGYLSRCRSGKRPHLVLKGESPCFSQVAAGNLEFLSSYNGDIRQPLVWSQESPVSMRVMRGLLGFLSSRSRSSSGAETATSDFLSSADMDLRVHMELPQGTQASSHVETCKSAFLPSCNSRVTIPVKLT